MSVLPKVALICSVALTAAAEAATGVAEWKNPVDGTWGDATKWTQAPSETMPAEIAVSGGSYTVRVAADVATTNVTVGAGVTGETNTLEVAKRMDASTGVFKLLRGPYSRSRKAANSTTTTHVAIRAWPTRTIRESTSPLRTELASRWPAASRC